MLKELPTLPTGIQALEAIGTVTAADYDQVFAPLIDRASRTGSRMRLLYIFGPGFHPITPGALWADARRGTAYARVLDGCAVVSDISWIRAPARGIGAWMPCPVRVYALDERDDAVAWLASLPAGAADVSVGNIAKAYVGGSIAAVGSLGGLAFSKGTKNRHGTR